MVFGLPRPILCLIYSRSTAPEIARELFLDYFLEETALSFLFLLFEPVQCLGKTFLSLIFSPILSQFAKLSAILKHGEKNVVTMTSIVCLPSNRS